MTKKWPKLSADERRFDSETCSPIVIELSAALAEVPMELKVTALEAHLSTDWEKLTGGMFPTPAYRTTVGWVEGGIVFHVVSDASFQLVFLHIEGDPDVSTVFDEVEKNDGAGWPTSWKH